MIDGLRVPVHLTSRESLRIFDMADIWAARTGERVRLVSANDHVQLTPAWKPFVKRRVKVDWIE